MKRSMLTWGATALLAALAACSGPSQPSGMRTAADTAYLGTGNAAFTDPNWKVGDAASWQEHMRIRAKAGQDEYLRSGGK